MYNEIQLTKNMDWNNNKKKLSTLFHEASLEGRSFTRGQRHHFGGGQLIIIIIVIIIINIIIKPAAETRMGKTIFL